MSDVTEIDVYRRLDVAYQRVDAVTADLERLARERNEARAEVETMRAVARGNKRHVATLTAILEAVERAAHVADPEDVTDWQRGYRACSERVLAAIAAPTGGATEQHKPCFRCRSGSVCLICEGKGCGWCPDCSPEVPEWTP